MKLQPIRIQWYVPRASLNGALQTQIAPSYAEALQLCRLRAPGGRIRVKDDETDGSIRITNDDGRNIAWLYPEEDEVTL